VGDGLRDVHLPPEARADGAQAGNPILNFGRGIRLEEILHAESLHPPSRNDQGQSDLGQTSPKFFDCLQGGFNFNRARRWKLPDGHTSPQAYRDEQEGKQACWLSRFKKLSKIQSLRRGHGEKTLRHRTHTLRAGNSPG
jgi:hypothetical protein